MAAFFAGLGGIFYAMGIKLIGYRFITRSVISGLKAWSKSTETTADDEVTVAMADAWDVPVEDLKMFLEEKQRKII